MKILVTGAAGFIGYHVARSLLERGDEIIGIDNLNDYYDVSLKNARLDQIRDRNNFSFRKIDVADEAHLKELFIREKFDQVIHLAAQAGVRYSLINPNAYVLSNLAGFVNILEACRHHQVRHLVYASSSSVYGANTRVPFSVSDRVDQPLSLYGATKKANEAIAYSYNHLFDLPVTGLRFFTVYGPWGRPDMSYFKFTGNIIRGLPIDVYNNGRHSRDFTYIDDIVDGVVRALDTGGQQADGKTGGKVSRDMSYRLYNLGNNKPVDLLYYISLLEKLTGKKAIMNMLPLQPGDMPSTCADIDTSIADLGYAPKTGIETGLASFVDWYRNYYHIS